MSTIIDQVAYDHKEIKTFFSEYEKHHKASNWTEAKKWYNQLAWEIARHSVGEEVVLYPWMAENTKIDVEQNKREHQTVKESLNKLDSLNVDDPSFYPLVQSVMQNLNAHMDLEEKQEFPLISQAASTEELISLGKSFERRKKIAPTKAHPSAPDTPKMETLAGLLVAPFDKLRDMFKDFPSEEEVKSSMKQNL